MINCNVTRDLLPLFHDGVCSEDSRKLVEAHVETCPDCRAILKELDGEIDFPHETPDDLGAMKKIENTVQKGKKRAWLKGAAAVLALALVIFAGAYGWWYVDTYCYYQKFAEGHTSLAEEQGYSHTFYEFDENGKFLGAVEMGQNRYQWSDGTYEFFVTVPQYPGDNYMLVVSTSTPMETRNISPGQEISAVLNFGGEEYAYYVGLYITTRTQVPGQAHLQSEMTTVFFMLDRDLSQIYPDYMDEETIAQQDALLEQYRSAVTDIIEAAQNQWPFLKD